MKTQLFIPYLLTSDNGEELKVTLRSIERNVKFEHEVVIFGDLPTWMNPESVIHINAKIPLKVPFNTFWDTIGKLRHFTGTDKAAKSILYTYDDIVFMQPVSLDDVRLPVALSYLPMKDNFVSDAGTNWKQVLVNTMHKLRAHNLPTLNYETHLPILFERDRLMRFFVKFGFNTEPYHMCSLYCNWTNDVDDKPVYILGKNPEQKIKYGLYKGNKTTDYSPALSYRYMNWAQCEWTPQLKQFLYSHFSDKSKYER